MTADVTNNGKALGSDWMFFYKNRVLRGQMFAPSCVDEDLQDI